jgi:hypothetical protein
MELSALALELENAADKEDLSFCTSKMPPFLEALGKMKSILVSAFAEKSLAQEPLEITPEMSSALTAIFTKLTAALGRSDFLAIDDCMEELAGLNPGGALQEEIEKIKDAVLMMDYDGTKEVMQKINKWR